MEQNAQQILWMAVGPVWWWGYTLVCIVGGTILFRQLLHSAHRDALTYARLVWLLGYVSGAFVNVNSACQPLSAALFATSGVMMSILLHVRWCERPGTSSDKVKAIIREALYPETKVQGK